MLKPIQERKLKKLYRVLDADGSGKITITDYEKVLDNLCQARGWRPFSREYEEFRRFLTSYWEALQQFADINVDFQVSLEEWCGRWSDVYTSLHGAGGFPDWFWDYSDRIMDAIDLDEDGEISGEDYETFLKVHGIAEDPGPSLRRLGLADGGKISREQMRALVTEFHLSDDSEAPGSWLYGEF